MTGRALITGGAGFLATHLARSLVGTGWRVDLLDDLSRGIEDRTLKDLAEDPSVRFFRATHFRHDGHWSPRGHDIAGRAVAKWLGAVFGPVDRQGAVKMSVGGGGG